VGGERVRCRFEGVWSIELWDFSSWTNGAIFASILTFESSTAMNA
jgi:hypothetical protein